MSLLAQAIDLLNTFANSWAAWIVVTFINTVIVLMIVGTIWFLLRRRLAPQFGYCLFLLVPLKLLVPVQFALPVTVTGWMDSERSSSVQASETAPASPAIASLATPARPASAESSVTEFTPAPPQPVDLELTHSEMVPPAPVVTPVVAPIPALPSPDQSPAARPSFLTIAMLLWLVCVLILAGRWLVRHWRFAIQLTSATPIDPKSYTINVSELCRRAGISSRIRFVESERVLAPAVAGIFRRTIILPTGLAEALTPAEIEWAVLHELAHIRRRDLLVILVQRLAALVHFFNPAIWIANRLAHQLREFACDDLASEWTGRTPAESGETFVKVLRFAKQRRQQPAFGLGILGLDARAARSGRVRRMLDRGEGTIRRPGRWSVLALCLIALIALPHLRAADESSSPGQATASQNETASSSAPTPTTDSSRSEEDAPSDKASAKDIFELLVLGPDGEPVPNIEVEFRSRSLSLKGHILAGQFINKGTYGTFVNTSPKGRIVVKRSRLPKHVTLAIEVPGFAPYWYGHLGSFPRTQPTPNHVTVQLEGAWSVGSVIVDSQGNPIPGVVVHPGTAFNRPPGEQGSIHVGTTLTTDENGRWRYDSAPNSADYVHVEINHPQYQPRAIPLKRERYEINPGEEPQTRVTLKPGLTVRGRVIDQTGKPIEGALLRIRFVNDERTDRTNADGYYKVIGCDAKVTQIVVSAEGMAIDAKRIHVEPDLAPVNFEMKPGGNVRIRVLDHKGNPIPEARIFFQDWRDDQAYFAFDRVNQYANKQGVWVWREAPHDEFTVDIGGSHGMGLTEVPLKAREKEYVFRLPPALVVSGRVVDAESKKPIENFKVVPGRQWKSGDIHWITREKLNVTDGSYHVKFQRQYPGFFVRVEAPGYIPGTSRELEYDDGNVTMNFALKKGTKIAAQVRTPKGKPAVGADVVLGLAGSQIMIENGRIKERSTYHVERRTTNEQGRFQFQPQASTYHLVILHPSGYAHVIGKPGGTLEPITLTAWALIEGTYFEGGKTRSGIPIAFSGGGLNTFGPNVPSISDFYEAETGSDGTFTFDRVVTGRVRLGRQIVRMVNEGAVVVASSKRIPLKLKAGETVHVQLGAKGRPLSGQLLPPENYHKDIIWSFAEVELRPNGSPPPLQYPNDLGTDTEARRQWFLEWKKTPAGQAWMKEYQAYQARRRSLPYWSASVDRHGKFQINSVTPGKYWLNVDFDPGGETKLGLVHHRVTVGPITDKKRHEPIELGKLLLKDHGND